MYKKTIYGVGVNDSQIQVNSDYKIKKCYVVWHNLIRRCYDEKYHQRRPTYKNCKVCDEWLYFSNFKKWFDENYRWDLVEKGLKLELDKDLLSNIDNKIYSPNTCVFLPKEVNSFLASKDSLGITFDSKNLKYRVRVTDFDTHKIIYLGRFSDIEEAKKVYIDAKKEECKKVMKYLKELNYADCIIDKICIDI